jgi:ABC-type amino acid transport system permease subunit
MPTCLADPIASLPDMQTRFARYIDALETHLGAIRPDGMDLSALKHQAMFARLMDGVAVSIALVVGATTMTMLCAIGFATLLVSPRRWLRWPALVVTQIGQTTPMPLLMFFGYVLAGGLTDYTASVAVGVSILILGVYNGCYASRAIAEVRRTAGRSEGVVAEREMARGEMAEGGQGWTRSMGNAIAVSWTQITAFVVNATKGTPAADMIGVPEFVSVLTDLSAYSWDRTPLFVTLLVFYSGLVLAVIFLLSLTEKWIVRAWSTRP